MKRRLLFVFVGLMLCQAFMAHSGFMSASTLANPDTLVWTWEVTSSTSTKTKSFVVEYSGSLQVDWGDGVVQTLPDTMSGKTLSHVYSVVANHSCSAVAAGITYYKADSRKLLSLDPSRAPNLTYLSFTSNQLTSVNLANNTKLLSLYVASNDLTILNVQACSALQTLTCSDNLLTNLDVSTLIALKKLTCHTNPLTSLNVSSTGALSYVSCLKCSLEVAALDTLFARLPVLTAASTSKNLFVLENPGSAGCRISVATNKRWTPDKGLTTCTVYLPDTACALGSTAKMEVHLINPMPVMAFELDIVLPNGLSLDTLQTCLHDSRKGGHLLSIAQMSDTLPHYKFLAYSLTEKDVFAGNSGAVLDLYLTVPSVEATYLVKINQAVLVDTLTNVTDLITMDGALSIATLELNGDVNSDQFVNVTDIVCLVAYINGRSPSGFNVAVADVDGNGLWNVADITKLVVLVNDTIISSVVTKAAQSTDLSANNLYDAAFSVSGNHLYLRPCAQDSTVLELCLDNVDKVQAYQVDVVLPEGVTLDEGNVPGKTDRSSGHALTVTKRSEGCYRLLSFAMKSDVFFADQSGVLASLPLQLAEGLPSSYYPVHMEESILTGVNRCTVSSLEYDCWTRLGSSDGLTIPLEVRSDGHAGLCVRGSDLRSVIVWDVTGRVLYRKDLGGADECSFSTGKGVYLVKVVSGAVDGSLQKVAVW